MSVIGERNPAHQVHQARCPLGCVVREGISRGDYVGRIVWHYGDDRHGASQYSEPLWDHMLVILPDNFKSSGYVQDPDYFACIVLSGSPRFCYEWWYVAGSFSHPPPSEGPDLFVHASPERPFRFGKPTFAGIGVPLTISRTFLHEISSRKQEVRLRPNSLEALLDRLGALARLQLAEKYPKRRICGTLDEDLRGTWKPTEWGYATRGHFSWGPYDWGRDYLGLLRDRPNKWVPKVHKRVYLVEGGYFTDDELVAEHTRQGLSCRGRSFLKTPMPPGLRRRSRYE
ncbi:hypothetical protein MMC30_000257 [Trapelia coarctata]|nr:hypothetical protein [Trapelia coarctata]